VAVLRSIERRIEALFEGAFGRAFRAHVQPVELARKLAKEMDDHRTASVTRVYVPNEYTVYLSPEDRDQFSSYEEALCKELQDYLSEHAQRERYVLPSAPHVELETDEELEIGVFGIATKMARTGQGVPIPEPAPPPPAFPETAAFTPDFSVERPRSYALLLADRRFPLGKAAVVIGRARECEIHISDPNVSRKHAEIRPDGVAYVVVDLDSTNGTELNGRAVKSARLTEGDTISVGQTNLTFVRE
jgi:hypothetical protein